MDSNLGIVIVFATASVAGVIVAGLGTVSQFMDKKIKILQLQSEKQDGTVDGLNSQVKQLQQEMAQLRDTTTQYDLSVDRTLHETQHRLSRLEVGGTEEPAKTISNADPQQSLGQR